MTSVPFKKKKRNRKKWVPVFAGGILGLHLLVFLLLAQCSSLAPGYEGDITYVPLPMKAAEIEVALEFDKAPEALFHQYISSQPPEEELVPLAEEQWNGWETLVALKVEESSPREDFRLTLEQVDPADRKKAARPYLPVFQVVTIGGRPFQPTATVPEASASFFSVLGLSICLIRRRR